MTLRTLARVAVFLALWLVVGHARAEGAAGSAALPTGPSLTSFPTDKGLPVVVRTGVYLADVREVKENDGTFAATVDVRLRWEDPRLRYDTVGVPGGFKEVRGAAAEARLAEIWVPEVGLANLLGEPSFQMRGVREYADGRVELLHRVTGTFKTPFDVRRFPFDRQHLQVEVLARRDGDRIVSLDYRQDDLDFSRLAHGIELDDWTTGAVDIHRAPLFGWYGESHARLIVGLEIDRKPWSTVPPIFIPLIASLLIPILSLLMNEMKVDDGGSFHISAFELANVIVGGLFAVIALNFTVNAEYRALATGDNTVAHLFGLNYLTLAVSLFIIITLFRFNLALRFFGKYFQEQLFRFLVWAIPTLTFTAAVAIVLIARA